MLLCKNNADRIRKGVILQKTKILCACTANNRRDLYA